MQVGCEEIMGTLKDKFGEKNPESGFVPGMKKGQYEERKSLPNKPYKHTEMEQLLDEFENILGV